MWVNLRRVKCCKLHWSYSEKTSNSNNLNNDGQDRKLDYLSGIEFNSDRVLIQCIYNAGLSDRILMYSIVMT